jgi:hypothetical protein
MNALTVARLLVRETQLNRCIDALFKAYTPIHEQVISAYYAYCDNEDDSLRAAADALQALWAYYDNAVVDLQDTALALGTAQTSVDSFG